MAGAKLDFTGGYMGFERVEDPADGKQYIRAVIHRHASGSTTSAPVELQAAMAFATEVVKQVLLADGHEESELIDLTWRARGRVHA